jgi:putative glutamine amidotransferase
LFYRQDLSKEVPLSAPLIGVTIHRQKTPAIPVYQRVAEASIESLSTAGAVPLLIPLGLTEAQLEALALRLDGILFSGGGDVQPQRYGSRAHPLVQNIDEDRDRLEIFLIKLAVRERIPFFGICRGLQVINVALGGTLYEDLADQRPNTLRHDYDTEYPRDYLAHAVSIQAGSRLAGILGAPAIEVNSLHHQGIRALAASLSACAWSPDGLVEAVELPDHPFGLAVQWHPECLQAYALMRRLFGAFISAAGGGW